MTIDNDVNLAINGGHRPRRPLGGSIGFVGLGRMGGAMAAMRELPDLARHAKSRLRERDRPIAQADLEELLRMLADAKQRIDAEMESDSHCGCDQIRCIVRD